MWLFKKDPDFDFMGRRRLAAAFTILLLAVALGALALRGLSLGLDFTGGTVVEVGFSSAPELSRVREALTQAGFGEATVQQFGSARELVIQLPPTGGDDANRISHAVLNALNAGGGPVEMRRVEFVGPQVGEELAQDGLLAMLYALGGVLLYVAFRFESRFAAGAVAALVHDITLTTGFLSLSRIPFDLTVLAALLAVVGYSLNDTIVVFDRIRENFVRMRKGTTEAVMNASINETLSRTLITSLTTLLVVVSLLLFGGQTLRGFSITLLVGILVGTYSSVFVASSAALALGVSKSDLVPPDKEGTGEGNTP